MKRRRSIHFGDPRQLDVFPADLPRTDPLHAYYRRLRKSGAWLTLDLNTKQIFVGRLKAGLPAWAVTMIAPFRDRIVDDLLRVEHGIAPTPQPEQLDGGAVLHRLTYPSPALDPPIRPRPAS